MAYQVAQRIVRWGEDEEYSNCGMVKTWELYSHFGMTIPHDIIYMSYVYMYMCIYIYIL